MTAVVVPAVIGADFDALIVKAIGRPEGHPTRHAADKAAARIAGELDRLPIGATVTDHEGTTWTRAGVVNWSAPGEQDHTSQALAWSAPFSVAGGAK